MDTTYIFFIYYIKNMPYTESQLQSRFGTNAPPTIRELALQTVNLKEDTINDRYINKKHGEIQKRLLSERNEHAYFFFKYICQNTPNMNIDQRHIYHYGSQGIRDEGWGCVYRNIQTMRAMNNMTIPTISTMQADIGIDPRGQGRALWIEPVDARRYFPPNNKLVLYTTAPNPESYMLRTKLSDFDRVLLLFHDFHTAVPLFFVHPFGKNISMVVADR